MELVPFLFPAPAIRHVPVPSPCAQLCGIHGSSLHHCDNSVLGQTLDPVYNTMHVHVPAHNRASRELALQCLGSVHISLLPKQR